MKLLPLLAQRSFTSFPLKSEPPQVKLVNDKEISLGLSYDDYIETFNSLMNVGWHVHPIRVSSKSLITPINSRRVVLLTQ